jgi:hypothetical protein
MRLYEWHAATSEFMTQQPQVIGYNFFDGRKLVDSQAAPIRVFVQSVTGFGVSEEGRG